MRMRLTCRRVLSGAPLLLIGTRPVVVYGTEMNNPYKLILQYKYRIYIMNLVGIIWQVSSQSPVIVGFRREVHY
jgi:hypothetical protein